MYISTSSMEMTVESCSVSLDWLGWHRKDGGGRRRRKLLIKLRRQFYGFRGGGEVGAVRHLDRNSLPEKVDRV